MEYVPVPALTFSSSEIYLHVKTSEFCMSAAFIILYYCSILQYIVGLLSGVTETDRAEPPRRFTQLCRMHLILKS